MHNFSVLFNLKSLEISCYSINLMTQQHVSVEIKDAITSRHKRCDKTLHVFVTKSGAKPNLVAKIMASEHQLLFKQFVSVASLLRCNHFVTKYEQIMSFRLKSVCA